MTVSVAQLGHQWHTYGRRQQVDRVDPVQLGGCGAYCRKILGNNGGNQACKTPEENSRTMRKPTMDTSPVLVDERMDTGCSIFRVTVTVTGSIL